jgi:hypothetical protein
MNKARRNELKMLKFKRRLKNRGIVDNTSINTNCFRTTGKPCSCYLCSSRSYKITGEKKKQFYDINNKLKEAHE